MAQEQSNIKERTHIQLKEPRRYRVVMCNDDFTTMDFVVIVLKEVFFMSKEKAEVLMLEVHNSNRAVVGIYTYDIATSKVEKATKMARKYGYPLRLIVEPEEE